MSANVCTLGSLFDGSGGFPLAGEMNDIKPVWASEIEPFPIRVTTKNFPDMEHLGDIHHVNGGEVEPVDIITFSSPCTNLSISGNRVGLDGEQSSLFFEAIRVIKEMREKTNGEYPKYAVFENVPGIFSTNQRRDFQCALESLCSVGDESATIPQPEKWEKSGCILGDGYSVAWRVLDAEYWGVPQRRKRVFIIADFTGHGAKEIFIEPSGLSGNFKKKRAERWRLSGSAPESTGSASPRTVNDADRKYIVVENHPNDSRVRLIESGIVQTLSSRMGTGGGNVPILLDNQVGEDDVYWARAGKFTDVYTNVAPTLLSRDFKQPLFVSKQDMKIRYLTPLECCRLQGFPDYWCTGLEIEDPTEQQLAFWKKVWDPWDEMHNKKLKTSKQIAKWLAKPPTDSAQYKMWGNGVALPCVDFILSRVKKLWDENH